MQIGKSRYLFPLDRGQLAALICSTANKCRSGSREDNSSLFGVHVSRWGRLLRFLASALFLEEPVVPVEKRLEDTQPQQGQRRLEPGSESRGTSQTSPAMGMDESPAVKALNDFLKFRAPENVRKRSFVEIAQGGLPVEIDAAQDHISGIEYREMVPHAEAEAVPRLDNMISCERVSPIREEVSLDKYFRADLDHVPTVYTDPADAPAQRTVVGRVEVQPIVDQLSPLQHGLSQGFVRAEEVGNGQFFPHPSGEPRGHDTDLEDRW